MLFLISDNGSGAKPTQSSPFTGISGTTLTWNVSTYDVIAVAGTVTAISTFNVTGWGNGVQKKTLIFQSGASAKTLTNWPASWQWANNTAPSAIDANTTLIIDLTSHDGGTNVTAEWVKQMGAVNNTPTATAPAAIDDLAIVVGNATIDLSWTAPDNGGSPITEYRIERKVGTGIWTQIATTQNLTYTNGSLTNGTQYQYRVTTVNAIGASNWSNIVTGTPSAPVSNDAPPAPNLSTTGATTVGTTTNLATLAAGAANNAVFYLPNGTYTNIENVQLKQGQRVIGQSATGVIIEGGGTKTRAFIGANNGWLVANMTFQNFNGGGPDPAQNIAVIDPKSGEWDEGSLVNAKDWRVHNCRFLGSKNVGVIMSHRTIIDDCYFEGHNPHAIGGGFGTGGWVHNCTFKDNGYTGASGSSVNNAQVKLAFWNVGPWGQTDRDTSRFVRYDGSPFTNTNHNYETPQTVKFTNNTLTGARNTAKYGAGSNSRGIWFDLDCRDMELYNNTFTDNNGFSIFFEGCNGASVHDNTFTGQISLVNILSTGTWTNRYWGNAAVVADVSDNIAVDNNTFNDCVGCIIFFLGARGTAGSDWTTPTSQGGFPVATAAWNYAIRNTNAPAAIGEASTVGASNGSATGNVLTGSSYGIGFVADQNMNIATTGNLGTYSFEGNTYPATFRGFWNGQRIDSLSAWQALGFDD